MVESGEEVFGVGGYLGSRCALALLNNADLKHDIISAHNPLSSFHTLDIVLHWYVCKRCLVGGHFLTDKMVSDVDMLGMRVVSHIL